MKLKTLFFFSVFLIAASSIAYEILAASALTIILGASILYFSLTIGVYLAALGFGAWLSSKFENDLTGKLIAIGSISAIVGGLMTPLIFLAFGASLEFSSWFYNPKLADRQMMISVSFWALNVFSFVLIFITGVLMGFALPFFSRTLHRIEELKNAISKVFLLDYLGSLIASVLIPVFLFPVIGLVKTSFLVGFLNLAGVFLLVVFSKYFEESKIGKLTTVLILAALIINAAGFIFAGPIENFLEGLQFGKNEILFYGQSPYQRMEFVRQQNGKIRFYLNGYNQFLSGDWDAAYHESFAHPALSLVREKKNAINVLVLGSGDGLLLREIEKYPEVKKITIVDIDEKVIEANSSLQFMKELNKSSFHDPRLKIVIADAFKYVQENHGPFDIIYIGFPTPTDYNLLRLYSKEFYSNVAKLLDKNGVGVVQTDSSGSPVDEMTMKTLAAASLFYLPYHPPRSFANSDKKTYGFGFVLFSKKPLSQSDFTGKKIAGGTRWLKYGNFAEIFGKIENSFWHNQKFISKINSVFYPCFNCISFFSPEQTFKVRFLTNFVTAYD